MRGFTYHGNLFTPTAIVASLLSAFYIIIAYLMAIDLAYARFFNYFAIALVFTIVAWFALLLLWSFEYMRTCVWLPHLPDDIGLKRSLTQANNIDTMLLFDTLVAVIVTTLLWVHYGTTTCVQAPCPGGIEEDFNLFSIATVVVSSGAPWIYYNWLGISSSVLPIADVRFQRQAFDR